MGEPTLFEAGTAALLMLLAANSAPWLTAWLLRDRGAVPLDCSLRWPDGVRLLGDHKTWRGLLAALLACGVASQVLGFSIGLGMRFGALAMAGDALSSMVKRRLRLEPGTEVFALDSVPEALLPLLADASDLRLNATAVVAVTLTFAALDAATAFLRRRRRRPT